MMDLSNKYMISLLIVFLVQFGFAQEHIYKEVGFTEQEIIYLEQNPDLKKMVVDYVKEHQKFSKEDSLFLKELIALVTHNKIEIPSYTPEDYPGKEEGFPFEWWKEPEKYISFESVIKN